MNSVIVDGTRSVLQGLPAPQSLLERLERITAFARQICEAMPRWGVDIDARRVIAGALVHDNGKVFVQCELTDRCSNHEQVGFEYLTANAFDRKIPIANLAHGDWRSHAWTLEMLVVAHAGRLRMGELDVDLDLDLAEMTAERVGMDRWAPRTEKSAVLDDIAAHVRPRGVQDGS